MWSRRALSALALVVTLATAAPAAAEIRIGEINSYSRIPAFTEPYRRGWQLALEEIEAQGGIRGQRLVVIDRDDAGKPANAVRLAEELVRGEGVVLLMGGFFSHVGLALSDFARRNRILYLATEPLSDALVWSKGHRYTFRLRPSTWMQAHMLAVEAAKLPATRWATIAPNYAYGRDAVAAFRSILEELRPDVVFVGEQWPPLFKIDAGVVVRALSAAEPEAIFNVTFGSDLAEFVREGRLRGLFEGRTVVSLLTGEPEYFEPLGAEAPSGWIVTGYPRAQVDTPAHRRFREAYVRRWGEEPYMGSLVGYTAMKAVAALLERAPAYDSETLVDTLEGLEFDSPVGPIRFRAIDHQSTMGTWVGRLAVVDGKPTMVDWRYADGADHLPPDEVVRRLRPAD